MGHCQIPPEGNSKRKLKKPYVKLQNLGAFFRRLRYIPGGPDTFPMGRGVGTKKERKRDSVLPPLPVKHSPSCFVLSLDEGPAFLMPLHGRYFTKVLVLTGETWVYMRDARLAKPAPCGISQCICVAIQTLCLPPYALAKPKASAELHQNQEKTQNVNCCQWAWACCTLQL